MQLEKLSRDVKIVNLAFLGTLLAITLASCIALFSRLESFDSNSQDKSLENRDILRMERLDTLNKAIQLGLINGEIELTNTANCKSCNSLKGSTSLEGSGWAPYSIKGSADKGNAGGKEKGLAKYLDALPVDPLNQGEFYFRFISSKNQGYKLAVPLESLEYRAKAKIDGGIYSNLYEVGNDLSLEF